MVLLLALSYCARPQAPAQINYQGIARNAVRNVLVQNYIAIRLSIHDENANGPVLYQEVRHVTTSNLGMFNIAIGGPGYVSVVGSLATVPWATGGKFLRVEMDPGG